MEREEYQRAFSWLEPSQEAVEAVMRPKAGREARRRPRLGSVLVAAVLAAALGLGSLVNGALLCYNAIKSDARPCTKLKQYLWAALCVAYAAFILFMQLYNFWDL